MRLLVTVVQGVLELVLAGALTFAVIRHLRGRRAPVEEIIRAGWGSLGRVFLVSLFVGLATFLGLLLVIVPGIMVMCMNWVAVPVAVVEETGYREALDRSQELTAGTRWPVFAVILVLWVLNAVVAAGVTRGALALVHRHSGQFTVQTATGLLTISMALVTLPLTCLSSAAAAVGYHDLRVNREGAGLEELVRVFE